MLGMRGTALSSMLVSKQGTHTHQRVPYTVCLGHAEPVGLTHTCRQATLLAAPAAMPPVCAHTHDTHVPCVTA